MAYQLTQADNAKGGKRSGQVRQAQALERHKRNAELSELMEGLDRENVRVAALAAVLNVGERLASADLPPVETYREAVDAVAVMEKAHKIMRLELGESTSNAASIHVDLDDLASKVERLRAAEGEAPPASA